eukprot:360183-Rhodomonas_salina.2
MLPPGGLPRASSHLPAAEVRAQINAFNPPVRGTAYAPAGSCAGARVWRGRDIGSEIGYGGAVVRSEAHR